MSAITFLECLHYMKNELLFAEEHKSTYENFIAACPHCGYENIYNRRDDLRSNRAISRHEVVCQNSSCRAPFLIGGDLINPAHQMILFGLYDFLNRRMYMQTVLTITQAYEVFFSHAVNIDVLYRPYSRDHHRMTDGNLPIEELNELYKEVNIETFNEQSHQLYKKTRKYAFDDMRHLFLSLQVNPPGLVSFRDSIDWIGLLPEDGRKVKRVSKKAMNAITNARLKELLVGILITKVNELRNRVIHKRAYRPTEEETRRCVEEAEELINCTTSMLKLGGTLEWYINGRDR